MASGKFIPFEQLDALGERLRKQGAVVVWTNGCFDLLHVGHIRNLQAARAEGDLLVVGLNSDDSVRRIKGPTRPINPADERAEIMAALACVDYVTVFDESTPEVALERLKPAIHCKGADYAPGSGRAIPEAMIVEAYGGRIVFLPLVPGRSTTSVIAKMRDEPVK